jgi:hypothetical protein
MRSQLEVADIVNTYAMEADKRIRIVHLHGQTMFPVIGASGGLNCAVMVYLAAGFLDDGVDLGRGGARKHAHGHSWAVQLNPWSDHVEGERGLLRSALLSFTEYLDEQGFR